MPRVLRIHNRLIIGGPAINVTYLTRYMAPEFETTLVIGGKDDHEQDAIHLTRDLGIDPVIVNEMRRDIHPKQDGIAYQKIKTLIEKFKPDVVHTHAAKAGVIGRLAAEACNVPVIVHTFHGHVFHSYFNKWRSNMFIQIERYLARKSSGIVAISASQKHELANVYGICPEKKVQVIPLGLDLEKFQHLSTDKRTEFRHRYKIADDEIAIGIIGRIVPIKNHSLFVSVANKIRQATDKKLKFIIVGDGDMRPRMEAEFAAAGIDYSYYPHDRRKATAVCTSWLTEMDEVLAGLDIVTLTSNNEGTPVSLIEAQAAGKPVISTRVGGVADVVVNGKSGLIVEPGNVEEFAAGLLKLIECPDMRLAYSDFGKRHVEVKYSYQRLVSDMAEYYNRLIYSAKN
jgi:glycosyltransferase involved in cell wall biosynthesis